MKQKMKQLMGILISLVMVLEGAGGLTVCAAEQTEPNAIEQRLQIDDVIYSMPNQEALQAAHNSSIMICCPPLWMTANMGGRISSRGPSCGCTLRYAWIPAARIVTSCIWRVRSEDISFLL